MSFSYEHFLFLRNIEKLIFIVCVCIYMYIYMYIYGHRTLSAPLVLLLILYPYRKSWVFRCGAVLEVFGAKGWGWEIKVLFGGGMGRWHGELDSSDTPWQRGRCHGGAPVRSN